MGLYNFKAQFIPHILDGSKQHTIRAQRKHPDKPGNICYLYTGLRAAAARLIGRAPCVRVEEIEINEYGGGGSDPLGIQVWINGEKLSHDEREALAFRDGFRFDGTETVDPNFGSFYLMMRFWEGRLPFYGHIIHWNWGARLSCAR